MFRWVTLLLMLLWVSLARADVPPTGKNYLLAPDQSSVEFLAVGNPSMLKIKGQGGRLSGMTQVAKNGSDSLFRSKFDFDLTTLETGISRRDTHMKEKYLETAKFPKATLVVNDLKASYGSKAVFKGDLTLHGVTKAVEGSVQIDPANESKLKANASFKIFLSDFAISIPSFAGITVANEVEVTVSALAAPSD